jgi:hypothetical protein
VGIGGEVLPIGFDPPGGLLLSVVPACGLCAKRVLAVSKHSTVKKVVLLFILLKMDCANSVEAAFKLHGKMN